MIERSGVEGKSMSVGEGESKVEAGPELLPPAEVARRLKVTTRTLSLRVERGQFPPPVAVPGGHPAWRKSDVEEWFAALKPLAVAKG